MDWRKTLETITTQQVQQFMWKNIVCQYGVPRTIIIDNGRHFIDKGLVKFYNGLRIKHKTSFVKHPQSNMQVEAINRIILVELKKMLATTKGKWLKQLLEVLCAYRWTPPPQSLTIETPSSLVYYTNTMISVEIGQTSLYREHYNEDLNDSCLNIILDLLIKRREKAHIDEVTTKQKASRRYNSKLHLRSFHKGNLVWQASNARKYDNKFSTN